VTLPSRVETVIVGAGQAGLTMSWYLRQGDREHVLLERRPRLGGGWLDRWDAFRLVTPNWTTSFPGDPYAGPEPHAFMPRDEVADRVAGYAERTGAPVHLGVEVRRIAPRADGFRLETNHGEVRARNVIVAIGSFHIPKVPPIASDLPRTIRHLHSHDHRREADLPAGAVIVVGSGQSGVQIAEELRDAGRAVYLSVGSAGYAPRAYRGSDFFRWFGMLALHGDRVGVTLPKVHELPDLRARLATNPQLSGHGGGHDVNLRKLAAEGITLLGRIERVDGSRLRIRGDLPAQLASADADFGRRYKPVFDAFIAAAAIDAPPDDRAPYTFEPPVLDELDLAKAGVSTVIWTSGYRMDFSIIEPPIVDDMGFPIQRRGISDVPGLSFIGLLWQHQQPSATLRGPALDGRYLAEQMGITVPPPQLPPFLQLPVDQRGGSMT
jgi:putative flavoprotein involved in K+ transport